MVAAANKLERLDVRIDPGEKAVVEKAAALAGLSSSAYVRSCVLRQAREDIGSMETITLSDRDRDLFLEALDDSLPSTGRLNSALTKFREKYNCE